MGNKDKRDAALELKEFIVRKRDAYQNELKIELCADIERGVTYAFRGKRDFFQLG